MKADDIRFDKKLSEKILPKFNNAKDWSDLMAILKNLKENLSKYKDFNMNNVSDKIILSKRLAQCLNPKSLPSGLHEIAIELYDIIFENIRKNQNNFLGDNLGLYSVGLFPFFQFATVPNKTLYLNNIIKKHYLELNDQEFLICLPGFLASILPCLDDQNEILIKSIKEIFSRSRQKVGDNVFFGQLWSVVLRTQRIRLVGMKYLMESIPIFKKSNVNEDENKEDLIVFKNNYYPNMNVLVINALISVIGDENVHVQRIALDFVISRFPLNNDLLDMNQKISLIVSGLNLLVKNEYSTTRRLISWLIGSNQDDDIDVDDPSIKHMMDLLIQSIKIIFENNKIDIKNSSEKLINSLKIIDQLFKQQVKLVDYILENIAIDLISSVEEYWNIYPKANINNNDVIKRVKKFFDYDISYLDCLWSGLNILLSKTVKIFENEEIKDINKLIYCLKLLKLSLFNIFLDSTDRKNKFYIPIISNLLKSIHFINDLKTDNQEKFDLEKNISTLCLKFTKELQLIPDNEINKYSKNKNTYDDFSDQKINKISKKILFNFVIKNSMKKISKSFEKNSFVLENLIENINKFQDYYIYFIENLLCEKEKITKNNIKIFRIMTELIIRIQEYSVIESIPKWVNKLIKVVFCENVQISLYGIEFFLDLVIINSDNNIFSLIKNFFSESIQDDDNFFQNKINMFNQGGISRNYSELTMGKLWILIDEQNYQKQVIDLIIKFYFADSYVFSNTISNSFALNDLDRIVDAIKKFTQFWKLTSEYYSEIIFFENGDCIFKMLDFLEDEHPLLRHLSKSWLSQSLSQFNKIIDPLIYVLLDGNTSWFISPQKQLFITNEYNNKRIVEAFRKLKNIIINMTDLSINFFISTPVSNNIFEIDHIGKEINNNMENIHVYNYLELIVSISLRFIQGKFIESVSQPFYRENFSVNAAACEFLEFLLSFIDQKSIVMKIAESITFPLLKILKESIISNDEVMQVQLLNLLKVILFNTQSVHHEFKISSKKIFDSTILHDCIILGIQDNYIFVRSHFISFLESCLPILKKNLEPSSHIGIASKLLISISDYLFKRVNLFKKSFESIDNNSNLQQNDTIDKYFIKENYSEENKENKVIDENDVNIILKGIKEILFQFLDIGEIFENSDQVVWVNFKKNVLYKSNPSTTFLSFFGSKDDDDNENKKNNDIVMDIYQLFENILAALISCWINESDTYMIKDLCLSQIGIITPDILNEFQFKKFQESQDKEFTNNYKGNNNGFSKQQKTLKTIKFQINLITFNLFLKNPAQFISRFINLWLNENNIYVSNDKQYKLSMIELLVSLNIPTEIILNCIYKNIDLELIKSTKKSKNKYKDIYPFILNVESCEYESKICQMIYSYIVYNFHQKSNINFIEIWRELINLLNIFAESKSPNTLFYVYEIINICLMKLQIKETSSDKTLKSKILTLIVNLFNKNMDMFICNKIDIIFEGKTSIILPLSPSFYEKVAKEIVNEKIGEVKSSYQNLGIKESSLKSIKTIKSLSSSEENFSVRSDENTLYLFYKKIHDYVLDKNLLANEEILMNYRIIGFITLKNLFYPTMKYVFSSDKNDKLVVHIQLLVKNLLYIMNDRTPSNYIFSELATEFLHSLIQSASNLVSSSCKNYINEFLDQHEFFNTTKNSLRYWKNIINIYSRNFPDMIVELLNKLNVSYFFSKEGDRIKTRALRRVSFIIYSCEKDHFSSKLGLILEKVKEVITTYSENPVLESEIFLMIRVMFLRFSHENLVETLRLLWPIIFGELASIIKEKKKNSTFELQTNSLKLVELLSLANIEEFGLYQWIFMLDTYNFNNIKQDNVNNEFELLKNSEKKSFKPIIFNLINEFKNGNDFYDFDIDKFEHDHFQKKGLILNVQKFSGKDEVEILLEKLFRYIILMNNFKSEIEWNAVEHVIEYDFLGINQN